MNTEHTAEPWFYGSYGDLKIVGNNKGQPDKYEVIANLGPQHFPSNTVEYANAERIVACVNACAGLENSFLEEVVKNKWQLVPTTKYIESLELNKSQAATIQSLQAQRRASDGR